MPRLKTGGSRRQWKLVVGAFVACAALFGCGATDIETDAADTGRAPPPGGGSATRDTFAPTVPSGLSAAAVSPTQVNLAWSESTDNVGVVAYAVYRNGVLLTTLGNVTTYQDVAAIASTTYSYTVRAFDGAGNASWQSLAVTVTTPAVLDTVAPTSPSALTATAVSSSQVNLSWTSATDNVAVTGYRIFRDGALLVTFGTATTFQDKGVTVLVTYVYTVRAVDAAGNVSSPSPAASATPQNGLDTVPPTTPTGIAGSAISPSQINLSWLPSTDNVAVAGYRVYRNGAFVVSVSTTTYQDTGLTPSTVYSYNVDAVDASGNVSGLSAGTSVTTLTTPDTTPPSTPTGLMANAVSASQINLSWSDATDNFAVTAYRVYRSGVLIATLGNVTMFQDIGLAQATTYTYRVRALDAAGNVSGQSAPASATTQAIPDTTAPSTPTGVSASTVSASRINVSWSASTDNVAVTGYRVYQNGVYLLSVGNVTSYQSSGLAASTTYTYRIDAIDAAGNASGTSAPASATTLGPDTATLAWDAVIHPNLGGYRVYYGTAPGVYIQPPGSGIDVGNVTGHTVTGLTSGTRYYFAVTAYDTLANESAFSNEVFKDMP